MFEFDVSLVHAHNNNSSGVPLTWYRLRFVDSDGVERDVNALRTAWDRSVSFEEGWDDELPDNWHRRRVRRLAGVECNKHRPKGPWVAFWLEEAADFANSDFGYYPTLASAKDACQQEALDVPSMEWEQVGTRWHGRGVNAEGEVVEQVLLFQLGWETDTEKFVNSRALEPARDNYVNLCPHSVSIQTPHGILELPPPIAGSPVARLEVSKDHTPHLKYLVPTVRAQFGRVIGLPEPVEGKIYVTSTLVASTVRRADVVSPGELVRTPDGAIVGCEGLVKWA